MHHELKEIYTIGHSTRSMEEFIDMLQSFSIELLIDVRHFPGSRRYPHFNKDALQQSLKEAGIEYLHLESLGGRRKPLKDSIHTAWRHAAFRGYADYMQTTEFLEGMTQLLAQAQQYKTAYMCSEAVWWRCHRSLISDLLKVKGWTVHHIMAAGKAKEHPYSQAATVTNGLLSYSAEAGKE